MKLEEIEDRIISYMISQLIKGVRDPKYVPVVEWMLSLDKCCDDESHRLQPKSPSDWKAVDNMMGVMFASLGEHVHVLVKTLHSVNSKLVRGLYGDDSPESMALLSRFLNRNQDNVDLYRNFVNIYSVLIREHYSIINEYDRVDGRIDADATTHYAKIIAGIKAMQLIKENEDGHEKESRKTNRCSLRHGQENRGGKQTTH